MNIYDYHVGKRALFTMMIFTAGSIVDHVTTYYGLTLPNVTELNQLVLMMIESGSWNLVEISILIMGNISVFFVSGSKSETMGRSSMTLLLLVGIVRLFAGFNNMMVIFNVVYI